MKIRTFSGHEDYFFMHGYVRLIPQKTRDHEFGTIANGVDSTVFNDNALVAHHQALQWPDDAPQV
jgi:hypothetical protein